MRRRRAKAKRKPVPAPVLSWNAFPAAVATAARLPMLRLRGWRPHRRRMELATARLRAMAEHREAETMLRRTDKVPQTRVPLDPYWRNWPTVTEMLRVWGPKVPAKPRRIA